MSASAKADTAPKPGWCTPAPCARSSARPRRRCSSPRATSTTAPSSAERRFKDEEPGYLYSRFANPTVSMFEQRMAALEGAEAARATATGMAAVTTALMGQVGAGDHRGRRQGAVRVVPLRGRGPLPRYGVASTLVDGTDLDQWRKAVRPNTKTFFLESPTNPTLEVIDIAGDRRDRARRGRDAGGRQRVLHAAVPERRSSSAPTASSIRPPSTSTARAAASAASSWRRRNSSRTTSTI